MPLYDCVMLLKPQVQKESLMNLVGRIGKHVYARNGVLTEVKSFGKIQLGYGIKKLDGRYFQGQLVQMTMMATPNINKELHYLNKEDRLLRWLLVKHRDAIYGLEFYDANGKNDQSRFSPSRFGLDFIADENGKTDLSRLTRPSLYDDDDADVEGDNDDDEYEVKTEEVATENKEV